MTSNRSTNPYALRDFDLSDLAHSTYTLNTHTFRLDLDTCETTEDFTQTTVSLDHARNTLSPATIDFFTDLGGTEHTSTLVVTDDSALLTAPYLILSTSTSPDGRTKVTRVFSPITD